MSSASCIGGLVRQARGSVPLEDLARDASIQLDALTALEEGRALLSTAKLQRIATVLGLDAPALIEGRLVPRPTPSLFFRQRGVPDFYQADLTLLGAALEAGRSLLEVGAVLGRPPSLRARFAPEKVGAVPFEDGYHAARRVRVALENTAEPMGDLRSLLEDRFDVAVCSAGLRTPRVLAATVKEPVQGAAAVVLNRALVSSEKPLVVRVTLAHELAHAVFDPQEGAINLVVDRDDAHESQPDEVEQRARAFAAELLVPLLGLQGRLGDAVGIDTSKRAGKLIDDVRGHWKTSAELTVNHLMNHGYIVKDETFRQELIAAALARGTQATIPPFALEDIGERRSIALFERVREAHDRTLVTDGRARELLGLSPGDDFSWDAAR